MPSATPVFFDMKVTGHASREMFDRYNTIDEEDRHFAMNRLKVFSAKSDQSSDQAKKTRKKGPPISKPTH